MKGSFNDARRRALGVDNNLPRESFKRGTDNRSKTANDKACVFCMIKNGNESFYASVPGTGYMLPSMLDKTIGKHVEKEDAHIFLTEAQRDPEVREICLLYDS